MSIEAVDDAPEMGDLPDSGLVLAFEDEDGKVRLSINEDEIARITSQQLIDGFQDPDSVFVGVDPTEGLSIKGLPTSTNGEITPNGDSFTFNLTRTSMVPPR